MLIPPVLFFAALAFVVSFVWFTLLYFVASLLITDRNHEPFKNDSIDHASDVDKYRREYDGQEGKAGEKDVKHVAELTGDSATAEVCVKRFEIKEMHVDGFSDDSRNISGMALSDACVNYEVHTDHDKLVEEVIIFETNREELNADADLDGSSERHQVQDVPTDWFVEELNIREVSTSGDSFPIPLPINSAEVLYFSDMNEVVGLSMSFLDENKQDMVVSSYTSSHDFGDQDEKYGEEFIDDRKEVPACTSSEICDFIDKHETREVVLDGCENDDKIRVLATTDGSAHDVIPDELKKEDTQEKDAKSVPELLVDSVANMGVLHEQQEIQKVVVRDENKLPEVLFTEANEKQIVGTSDEVQDFTNESETSGLSIDSVCEDKTETAASSDDRSYHYIGDEDDKREELIENNREEASGNTSVVCDFADNHQTKREALDGFATDGNTGEVPSLESPILGRTEDEDEKIDYNCNSKVSTKELLVYLLN